MLDIDTISRLNKIKKYCMPDRPSRVGPQVILCIESQLKDLLNNPRRKRINIQVLKDKYHVKPRNGFVHDLKRKLTRSGYRKEWSIMPF